jgi:hypothetical protein
VKVSAVSGDAHHSVHSYYVASPESPDGRFVVFYASTHPKGYEGEVRVRERATGKETVLARDVVVEDAHRAACQQWASGGRRVVYHTARPAGWVVVAVDVATGKETLLARDRQVGFGRPEGDVVPLYAPHWKPGGFRDVELADVGTGEVRKAGPTADGVRKAYPEWAAARFGDRPLSLYFPVLSPDGSRVFFKVAAAGPAAGRKAVEPDGAEYRTPTASTREGLLVYDLRAGRVLVMREKWGHPAWHPDSRHVLEVGGEVIDVETGKVRVIPDSKGFRGEHPSFGPAGDLLTRDVLADADPIGGPKGSWAVVVADARTGKFATLHRFDNTKGARSWRASHPHPAFSADGRRVYFNVSDGEWTRLHVAERAR